MIGSAGSRFDSSWKSRFESVQRNSVDGVSPNGKAIEFGSIYVGSIPTTRASSKGKVYVEFELSR